MSSSVRAMRSAGCSAAIVIGHTPLDIQSAQERELQVVAVLTGLYSVAELRGWDPDLLIEDCESGSGSLAAFLNVLHA